jgi:hypothetical protein
VSSFEEMALAGPTPEDIARREAEAGRRQTRTMTLTEFLLARIAEDEETAERTGGSRKRWEKESYPGHRESVGYRMRFPGPSHIRDWSHEPGPGSGYFAVTEHCERFDPARVLAECEAKRRIVEEHARVWVNPLHAPDPAMQRYMHKGRTNGLYFALQALALPYADHPDYREEWRP